MNILIINHYIGPEKYSPPYRTNYLAQEWVKNGHKVIIVGASYSHLFFKYPVFSGLSSIEVCKGVIHKIIKVPSYKGNGIMRVVNMLAFVMALIFRAPFLSMNYSPDIVIAASVYPLDFIPALLISRLSKSILIREVRDLWPLTLVELGNHSLWDPFIIILRLAQRLSFHKADLIITTLANSFPYMNDHGLIKKKWRYIPQGFSANDLNNNTECLPDKLLNTLIELKERGMFIVGYAGGHGTANALNFLIDAGKILNDKPVSIVLIGQGEEKERLIERIRDTNIKNVFLFPPISKKLVPKFLASVDCAYIGWQRKSIYRFGISPNKLMDYMSCGKPVIHSTDCKNDPVEVSKCGFVVPAEDSQAIAEKIIELMNANRSQREKIGLNGKLFIENKYNYSVLATTYIEIIKEYKLNSQILLHNY